MDTEKTTWPVVDVDDKGIRPAGKPDQCFYCQSRVGEAHGRECVIVSRIVRVRVETEILIAVPHFWGAEEIEFHRNESSWCADNLANDFARQDQLRELTPLTPDHVDCLCGRTKIAYIGDADSTPRTIPDRGRGG